MNLQKKIPLTISVCLFSLCSLVEGATTFNATRTITPPTESNPTRTTTWTGDNNTVTITETPSNLGDGTYELSLEVADGAKSRSGSLTATEGDPTFTVENNDGQTGSITYEGTTSSDGGDESTTSYEGTTPSGESFDGGSTWSQLDDGQGQEQYNIDVGSDGSVSQTVDYGGGQDSTYESSATTATGGSESGSGTGAADGSSRTGTVDLTPGTDSQYYGNTYELDYTTDNEDQSVSGTITEESPD